MCISNENIFIEKRKQWIETLLFEVSRIAEIESLVLSKVDDSFEPWKKIYKVKHPFPSLSRSYMLYI